MFFCSSFIQKGWGRNHPAFILFLSDFIKLFAFSDNGVTAIYDIMAGMSGVGSFLAVTGCFTAFAACVIHCVGFGTSHWLEGDGYSPFVEIGLFRACFDKCTYPFCPAGDNFIYDGCWKLWDEHFMELWTWMKPGITIS